MKRTRFISILCGALWAVCSPSAWAAPVATRPHLLPVARVVKSSCQPPAKPRGVRVTIRSYFNVTDSADGFSDNEVEVYGAVNFNGQAVWNIARTNARDAVGNNPSGLIYLSLRTFDVIYDKPSTWQIMVSGYLNDRDKGSKDDTMWNPQRLPRVVDIKQLSDRYKVRRDVITTLRGDQKSENADLVFSVTKSTDIF